MPCTEKLKKCCNSCFHLKIYKISCKKYLMMVRDKVKEFIMERGYFFRETLKIKYLPTYTEKKNPFNLFLRASQTTHGNLLFSHDDYNCGLFTNKKIKLNPPLKTVVNTPPYLHWYTNGGILPSLLLHSRDLIQERILRITSWGKKLCT